MPLTRITATGQNYIETEKTDADGLGFFSHIYHYEKQLGSAGAVGNTLFTLSRPYVIGSETLMVFVNGQKAERVASGAIAMQYVETDIYRVTFGASLNALDVVEFMVIGTYNIIGGTGGLDVPIGFVFPVVNSNVVPTTALECNGALISQTTYSSLYSGFPLSIGGTYGISGGDFRLPDFRGRVPRGWDNGAGRDPNTGSRYADTGGVTGNNVGSMQDDDGGAVSHDHPVGSHTHSFQAGSNILTKYESTNGYFPQVGALAMGGGNLFVNLSGQYGGSNRVLATLSSTLGAGSGNTGSGGGGASAETRMKNFNVMWCIKY